MANTMGITSKIMSEKDCDFQPHWRGPMYGGTEGVLWLIANKEARLSVQQPPGTEACQQVHDELGSGCPLS